MEALHCLSERTRPKNVVGQDGLRNKIRRI